MSDGFSSQQGSVLGEHQARVRRVMKFVRGLVAPTYEAIGKHVGKLKREAQVGKKPRYRSLRERTGLKFRSGSARKFKRRHAKRVLAIGKMQARRSL